MSEEIPDWQQEKPLGKLTCSSYDCDNELHSFRTWRPKKGTTYRNEYCRACDADLVDWHRIDKKNLGDIDYTFTSLRYELFRHHYWHKEFDERALEHAKKKGMIGLREQAEKIIKTRLGKSALENAWDGRQTPLGGNVIHYAQHATASCCRKCAEEWFSINRNTKLKSNDADYLIELITKYIKTRLPNLPDKVTGKPKKQRKQKGGN